MKKHLLLLGALFYLGLGTLKAQPTTLLNFDVTNGVYPYGSLTLSGNTLYGMTFQGHDSGNIFSIDTNGIGYKDMFDFNSKTGTLPIGNLILSGSTLYGMTYSGGQYNKGCIFSINTSGSGYKELLDFNDTNGSYPEGSLLLSGDLLYGMTAGGGANGVGCLFSIDTTGSTYKTLYTFNNSDGSYPEGSLILSANRLYGMTASGGADDSGCVFSINITGTGYTDLLDFYGANGSTPYGDLTLSGNVLYGMTTKGGLNNVGCIFSMDSNGIMYNDLHDFNDTDGAHPNGSLTLSGSLLYGMTSGYPYNYGNIFSIDTNGVTYKNLNKFDSVHGAYPLGDITLSGKSLYGMTNIGGLYNAGVIFRFNDTNISCTNSFNQDICIVTTDTSTNKNVIIWGRNNSPPDGSFNIYDSTLSGWVKIGSVPDTALSEYIDTASSPNTQSYSYRISTVDSCGESMLSPLNSTIYLQVLQLTGRDSLYWTPYIGFTTAHYLIYRGLSLNALTLIDSVSGTKLYYVDTLPPAGSVYLIETINPSGGCAPTHRRRLHSSENDGNTIISASNKGVPSKLTGINRVVSSENSANIFPNPNSGRFVIKSAVSRNSSSVKIYNVLGENIYNRALSSSATTIDLSGKPTGVYFYRILSEDGNLISEGKLIIQ